MARGESGGISEELLSELQREVCELETDRGTSGESIAQKSLILSEETFEVLKLLRPRVGIATGKNPSRSLGEELTDILFVGAAIANRMPVELDVLWRQMSVQGNRVSASEPSSADKPELLEAILDLAEKVLVVVSDCRSLDSSDGAKPRVDSLAQALGRMALQVQLVAITCDVDMKVAIRGKLMKDQLRLWST